jgi:hypothetical protein
MPKKEKQVTQAEQSERFRKEAQRLIDAGELDPIEADRKFERLVREGLNQKRRP